LYERDKKGEIKGARRIKDALQKHKVSSGNRVMTSRDTGMNAVKRELKRSSMPRGVEQWQIPVALGAGEDTLSFTGRLKPGAKVPKHAHKQSVFRVVISGSLKSGGKTLKAGDWMFVPAGQSYELQAGPEGCWTFYHHGLPVPPKKVAGPRR
jgi:hypothetical protein